MKISSALRWAVLFVIYSPVLLVLTSCASEKNIGDQLRNELLADSKNNSGAYFRHFVLGQNSSAVLKLSRQDLRYSDSLGQVFEWNLSTGDPVRLETYYQEPNLKQKLSSIVVNVKHNNSENCLALYEALASYYSGRYTEPDSGSFGNHFWYLPGDSVLLGLRLLPDKQRFTLQFGYR